METDPMNYKHSYLLIVFLLLGLAGCAANPRQIRCAQIVQAYRHIHPGVRPRVGLHRPLANLQRALGLRLRLFVSAPPAIKIRRRQ